MDAFDADVLIYAAAPGHVLGRRVRRLLDRPQLRVGSLVLLLEVLPKPLTQAGESSAEVRELLAVLGRLDLRPLDAATARVCVDLASRYDLKAADAAHLGTAVVAGADRFVTNNRRDFSRSITEIDIVYPDDLPDLAPV